jgi:hypothetical protein
VDRVEVFFIELELLRIILRAVRVDRDVVEIIDVVIVMKFSAAADQLGTVNLKKIRGACNQHLRLFDVSLTAPLFG